MMRVVVLVLAMLLGGMAMGDNAALTGAKRAKKDEFYTQRVDIENELRHYKAHFKGKVVLCNCDDPRESEFFKYFVENFEKLGLKRLIATCYKSQDVDLFSQGNCERAIKQVYEGDKNGNMVLDDDEVGVFELRGDGDFRSEECIEILKEADIVVTNPPFSLFREYVAQLVKYGKKFLILGNKNAIHYKEIFPLFQGNKIWLGVTPMSREIYFSRILTKLWQRTKTELSSSAMASLLREVLLFGSRTLIIENAMKSCHYTRDIHQKSIQSTTIIMGSM